MQDVPFISDDELAVRALQLLNAHQATHGPILSPPVPIELIVENTLDLTIDWTEGAPFDRIPSHDRVLAAITPDGRKLFMNLRQRQFFDRYFGTIEYSLAHEAGHALLHLAASPGIQSSLALPGDGIVYCRSGNRDRREFQAERFAASLLMPEHLLHQIIGGKSITTRYQIDDLRLAFRVSFTAMTIRLAQLDLAHVDTRGRVFPNRAAMSGQRSLW